MIDRLDNEISTLRTAMNLRAYRQEVLASNIANADTPHYKARDLDFSLRPVQCNGRQELMVACR